MKHTTGEKKCVHKRFALTDKCSKCGKSVFIAFDNKPTPSTEGWEKEFKKKFVWESGTIDCDSEPVIAFIAQVREEAVSEYKKKHNL